MKLNCMKYEHPVCKWLRLFSPCMVLSICSFAAMIYGLAIGNFGAIFFLPLFIIFCAVGMIVKNMGKKSIKAIWVNETIIIMGITLVTVLLIMLRLPM